MKKSSTRRIRALRRWGPAWAAGATAAAVGLVFTVSTMARATPLFSDDFEDGNYTGWAKSGGDWSVVADGSNVFKQGKLDSDLARMFAGSTGWTDYSAQTRVKPLAFGTADAFDGLAARASGATTFYRLILTSGNRAELQAVTGGSVSVLGGAAEPVATNQWATLRLDVTGTTITGYLNGAQVASATSTAISAGQIGLQTYHATAEFDDVTVSSTGSPPPPTSSSASSPPSTPPSTTPSTPPSSSASSSPPPPASGLVGWASMNGGTTGGAGGSTVTVTNATDLSTAVTGDAPKIVQVSGKYTCSADVRVGSNTTVVGLSGSSLTGCGLNMRGVHNVIVRNMTISKVLAGNGNGDAVHIDGSTNLWIDHNDLSSDTTHGTDYYDGLLDITHAADYITVSWNHIHDHIKCSLVGHSDSNASEDTGHLRVTYHHNWFDTCAERNPRVRFGNPVHVFNNYYVNNGYTGYSYGIASTDNAGILVEGDYFENIADPFHVGEGDSPPGNLVARNNFFVNSGAGVTSGTVAAIPYSYQLDAASAVKGIVTSGAGPKY